MATLSAIREQRRSARLTGLRLRIGPILAAHAGGEVWLFGSLARGDWDGLSDVDLLAVAPSLEEAQALADGLLAANLGDDVIPLSGERWQELRTGLDPYWRAIGREAIRLDAP